MRVVEMAGRGGIARHEGLASEHRSRQGGHRGRVGRARVDDRHRDPGADLALTLQLGRVNEVLVEVVILGSAGQLDELRAGQGLLALLVVRGDVEPLEWTGRRHQVVPGDGLGPDGRAELGQACARDRHREGIDVLVLVIDPASEAAHQSGEGRVGLGRTNDHPLAVLGRRQKRQQQQTQGGGEHGSRPAATDRRHGHASEPRSWGADEDSEGSARPKRRTPTVTRGMESMAQR